MLEKKSEKIQNIFPEHFKLFMIFWMQNNFFLKNKFVQLKSKMAATGILVLFGHQYFSDSDVVRNYVIIIQQPLAVFMLTSMFPNDPH